MTPPQRTPQRAANSPFNPPSAPRRAREREDMAEVFSERMVRNRRQQQQHVEKITATPRQIERFFALVKGFVSFYTAWERENDQRTTLEERLPFAELLVAFGELASNKMPQNRIRNFAAVDCLQMAFIGFLLNHESKSSIRRAGQLPESLYHMLQAPDTEALLVRMELLMMLQDVCNTQFTKLFDFDFSEEVLEERRQREEEAAAAAAEDNEDENDDDDDFWAQHQHHQPVQRALAFGGGGGGQSGGKPCGLPPWDKPTPRYANNAANRRRFRNAPWHGEIPECPPRAPRRRRRSAPRRRSTTAPDTWPLVKKAMDNGTVIGEGKEAVVYKYKGDAWKVYNSGFKKSVVQNNLDFLHYNRDTGVVPKYYDGSARDGWIRMEYLSEYEPLDYRVRNESSAYRSALLKLIAQSRAKLPLNVKHNDMRKWGNIAVRHNSDDEPVHVKFYESGTMDTYKDKLRSREYVLDVAAALHMTRDPFTKKVKASEVPWL